jgi:glucokinase
VARTYSGAPRVIALDIGGSSVKSGVVAPGGQIIGEPTVKVIDTQADPHTIVGAFAAIIRHHLPNVEREQLLGIAIGCPGPFDYAAGISYMTNVAKYEAIYGLNLRVCLRIQLDMPTLPIVFRNDAEAAILGEAWHGVGRAYRRLIGITLGTGLGSAFVVDGVIVLDGPGVPENGWFYSIPYKGTPADEIFSARGLLARLSAADVRCTDVTACAAAARAGNVRLRQGFIEFGDDLGRFLRPFVLAFRTEAVLILGGIAGALDLFGAAAARRLPVAVTAGQLGAQAAHIGAAELLFNP